MGFTAMGDFDGVDDTSFSDNATRKTDTPKNNPDGNAAADENTKGLVDSSGESNILNSYRSMTYSFTLAGLKKGYLTDPKKYRDSELDLIILKSGGKGDAKIQVNAGMNTDGVYQKNREDFAARDPRRLDLTPEQKNTPVRDYSSELLDGFNTSSPGRYDMFIENVEIDTLMAFTAESGSTMPTQIKFDVIEPYSVNGFIEALHIAAIAAGYPSYLQASFVLKMDFWGYPDSADFTQPEIIPKSTRYFPIGLTGIEVDITERGTRYKISAVPYNERAFGEPNVIKKPIQMSGSTIKEILTNLMKNVNDQVALSDKDGKPISLGNKHNLYKIKFPSWDDKAGWQDTPDNELAGVKLVEILKDNALYKMVDPATTEKATAYKKEGTTQPTTAQQAKEPEAIKYTPGKTVVQFAENMNLHEAITSVIRDSEYSRNILKDVKKNIDEYGMIKYFMIKIEVANLSVIDETSKKPFQEFTYVVTPYRVHYTRIPTYAQSQIDEKKLKKISLRSYDYIYTGKNVDVINFKLNFNTLFFEAVPAAFGNSDVPSAKTGAAPDNGISTKQGATPTDVVEKQQVPTPPTKVQPTPVQPTGGTGGQLNNSAYGVLARKMHESIIDSKASMITGDLEILGDPFYIATGGVGNYVSTPAGRGKTADGEADHLYSEVLININFRNPVDIDPITGRMYFDPNLIPFSGIYKVNKVSSTFKDGIFKQRLEILRLPGQILDQNIKPSDPATINSTVPDSSSQVIPDTTRSLNPSQRLDSSSALEQLGRGLPSSGLPGELSNFTAATGGLGGSWSSLLTQTPGSILQTGGFASGSSVIGQSLPTDMTSNIRLNAAGLAGINQTGLGSGALVASAENILSNNSPSLASLTSLANSVNSNRLDMSLNKFNIGSGIGQGASIKLPTVTSNPTALDIKFGSTIDPTRLAAGSVNNVLGASKELGSSAIGVISSLGSKSGTFASDIGNKISAFAGSSADPSALGARVGLDISKLSGLGGGLQSKVLSQIAGFGKNTPENVNLNQAADAGIVLDYIPSSKLKNIPPTTPYSTAPTASVDVAYVNEVTARGGATALANLYGVSDVKHISSNLLPSDIVNSALQHIPTAQVNPFSNIAGQFNTVDLNSTKDKFSSSQAQLAGLTGKVPVLDAGLTNSVGTAFGSNSIGTSPLDKLVSGKFNLG